MNKTDRQDRKYQDFRERVIQLNANDAKDDMIIHHRLYSDLSIIDTKVGALLQLAAILSAVYSLIISPNVGTSPFLYWRQHIIEASLLFGGFISTFMGVFCCLSVLWLRWARIRDGSSIKREAIRMFLIRNRRTRLYRSAWVFSAVGAVFLIIHLVLASSLHDLRSAQAHYEAWPEATPNR